MNRHLFRNLEVNYLCLYAVSQKNALADINKLVKPVQLGLQLFHQEWNFRHLVFYL